MVKALFSIKPEYVEKILDGSKIYEYRKVFPNEKINKIVIYSTTPIKKVVGEVEVLDIIKMDKEELWELTKNYSGITKDFFDEYYKSKSVGVAYLLGKVIKYKFPKSLEDIGVKVAPQSYIYINLMDNKE